MKLKLLPKFIISLVITDVYSMKFYIDAIWEQYAQNKGIDESLGESFNFMLAELDIAKRIRASMLPCVFPAFPEREENDIDRFVGDAPQFDDITVLRPEYKAKMDVSKEETV